MRCLATLFLFVTFICVTFATTSPVNSQDTTGRSAILQEDRSAAAARILAAAQRRLEEFQALEAVQKTASGSLAEALQQEVQTADIEEFKKRHRVDLRLAQFSDKAYAWQGVADAYRDAGRFSDAYAAAWQMLEMANSGKDEAAALDAFAKTMLADRKAQQAIAALREAQAIHPQNSRQTWLDSVTARFTLRVVDQTIDVEGPAPRACLILSHDLKPGQTLPLQDFVRIDGNRDIAIQGQGNRVCLQGLTFGDTVQVMLLSGLAGQDDAVLYADTKRTFTVPDRKARLLFGNGTYILPQVGDETVPLKSVNINSAKLRLYRIPDRGLVSWLSSGYDSGNLTRWAQENLAGQLGERVWDGTVEIETAKNEDVTTLVPIREMLTSIKPGVYALVATTEAEENRHRWIAQQTQWLVISDIGIMALHGSDGMHVFLHSLETAKPLRNVSISILGRNNDILAENRSDRHGRVTVGAGLLRGTGGNTPVLLAAQTQDGDFSFMRLQGPALDLSDRGTEGRNAPAPLDAFLFTERGIYRPGETVYLSALLRDEKARAVGGTALNLVVTRPDGVEALKTRLTGDELGTYAFDYALSPAARTGMWHASLHADDGASSVGDIYFQVDAFVPQRLKATLDTVETELAPGSPLEVHVQADFLYGAPAANLNGTLTATLEVDPVPFRKWKTYQFGLQQETFEKDLLAQLPFTTGATGLARVALSTPDLPVTTLPLRARLSAEVQDVGGRPVRTTTVHPVKRPALLLGVRSEKPDGFDPSEPAELSVLAVSGDGDAIEGQQMTAVWVKEHYSYTWYQNRGRWQYRTSLYDEIIGEETVITGPDGTALLTRPLGWGRYRLDVTGPNGAAASSRRFTVGWWSNSTSPDVPDALELTIEQEALSPGDKVRGFVKAPFEGVAVITVANDRLLETKTIQLTKDGGQFDFRVGKDWGPSAYILATALRPNAGNISRLPVRATGLAWFSVGRKERSRKIQIDVPDIARPGEPVTIPVKLLGDVPSGAVSVTFAAVDEGILNITRFRSPNPDSFFFGKRAFGFDVRDIYGRLIRSEAGSRGKLRSGGDRDRFADAAAGNTRSGEDNLASQITRARKTIALITRDVRLDKNGEASVTLDIPDFMGSLRLMAVASSRDSIGTGSANLTVRTPVVADLITPRFLAPGDTASATFSIQNLSGRNATFNVTLSSDSPALNLTLPQESYVLANGERQDVIVPLKAETVGEALISLNISGSGIMPVSRQFSLSVRSAWPYSTQRTRIALEPGGSRVIAGNPLQEFHSATVSQSLSVSSRPNLEAGRLFQELDAYPYRCSEQTVSRALPSLFHAELNGLYGLSLDPSRAKNTVEKSIMILLDRQQSNGGFGLWSSHGGGYEWLDAYVTDYLMRAGEKGFFVPASAMTLARNRLKAMTARRGRGFLEATAYAHYVLARTGDSSASEVRYFADQFGGRLRSPIALAQVAGALSFVGEAEQAERFFIRAVTNGRPSKSIGSDYGSALRDLAAITAIITETGYQADRLASLADRLESAVASGRWYSTQEMAWITRAAASFADGQAGDIRFSVGEETFAVSHGFWRKAVSAGQSLADLTIENRGSTPIRAVHLVRGIPKAPPAESSKGFFHSRSFYDLSGTPLSADALPRNGRFVVVLQGQASAAAIEDPLIVDLLPAGLEIETTDTSGLKFLARQSSVEFSDARDDRFVAALKIRSGTHGKARRYQVAYIVRAVTPGDYVMPGPFVEDMYQPHYRFQGATTRLVVSD